MELDRRLVAQRWAVWLIAAAAVFPVANAVLQFVEGHLIPGVTAVCSAVAFTLLTVLVLRQRRGAPPPRHAHPSDRRLSTDKNELSPC